MSLNSASTLSRNRNPVKRLLASCRTSVYGTKHLGKLRSVQKSTGHRILKVVWIFWAARQNGMGCDKNIFSQRLKIKHKFWSNSFPRLIFLFMTIKYSSVEWNNIIVFWLPKHSEFLQQAVNLRKQNILHSSLEWLMAMVFQTLWIAKVCFNRLPFWFHLLLPCINLILGTLT